MIIIAFSRKTSKLIPRIFCKKYRHVAPIVVDGDEMIMLQFVCTKNIAPIKLRMRDIKILAQHGWDFIYVPCALPHDFSLRKVRTCVELTKRALDIHDRKILTPFALYKKIR